MSGVYRYRVHVQVKNGTPREEKVREALVFYGLSDSDMTALFDRLLDDFAGIREFNRRLDVEIAEKEKSLAELKGRRMGGVR